MKNNKNQSVSRFFTETPPCVNRTVIANSVLHNFQMIFSCDEKEKHIKMVHFNQRKKKDGTLMESVKFCRVNPIIYLSH